jgi:cytochrome c553
MGMKSPISTPTLYLLGLLAAALQPAETARAADPIEEKAATCAACHGENGRPQQPDMPIIWGQNVGYLYLQLRDFKNGDRANPIMSALTAEMSRDEMLKLAEHFSRKPWPRGEHRASEAQVKAARPAISAGQCVECHLAGYLGHSAIPRIGGQQYEYLKKTMFDFKNKERANNPAMTDLFRTYPDEALDAMASLISSSY